MKRMSSSSTVSTSGAAEVAEHRSENRQSLPTRFLKRAMPTSLKIPRSLGLYNELLNAVDKDKFDKMVDDERKKMLTMMMLMLMMSFDKS